MILCPRRIAQRMIEAGALLRISMTDTPGQANGTKIVVEAKGGEGDKAQHHMQSKNSDGDSSSALGVPLALSSDVANGVYRAEIVPN